ncbi:ATP-binding protein [Brasilonema sp. CT11]|nr:ATP-binding protein [Brasilonema sp. CT11]
MSQVFGEFIEDFTQEHDSLELSFTSSARSIKQHWRNLRLSAYFVADYFSTFLPDEPDSERIKAIKNNLSYISNELLENAIKFDEKIKNSPVKFGVHFLKDFEKVTAVIFTKNSMTTQKVEIFQALIKELLSADTYELYVQQVEKTSEDEQSEVSGLGLLTIINDYSAKLGWKFESDPIHPKMITVTTMAQVVV